MGSEYWKGLIDWIYSKVLEEKCVDEKDLKLMFITDDPAEVANGIERHYQRDRVPKNF